MNRQRLILFILVIIFVIACVWSYTAAPRPKTVDKLTYVQGQQVKPAPPAARTNLREVYDGRILNLPLLEKESADFKGYRRNIFKPIFVDEQKLLKQKAAAIKPPQLPPVQSQKAAPAEQVVVQPQAAALARFTFLGFIKKDAQRIIFLAKDKDIILVKKGDKIAGRYEASSITDQALTLLVTDTGDEIIIPLIENRPLAASR
jgi:hypothetical protein